MAPQERVGHIWFSTRDEARCDVLLARRKKGSCRLRQKSMKDAWEYRDLVEPLLVAIMLPKAHTIWRSLLCAKARQSVASSSFVETHPRRQEAVRAQFATLQCDPLPPLLSRTERREGRCAMEYMREVYKRKCVALARDSSCGTRS